MISAEHSDPQPPRPAVHAPQVRAYVLRKVGWGVLLAGVAFAASVALRLPLGWIALRDLERSVLLALGGWLLVLPVVLHSARQPKIQAAYPELRVQPRTPHVVAASAFAWLLYLLGYELFFRGLLLHWGIALWGLVPGVAVMTLVYVLAHLGKPRAEMLICFVVGPAFAALTLWTGTIWSVTLLHILIALTNENAAAHWNPEFRPNSA